jgi:hypothetical protein
MAVTILKKEVTKPEPESVQEEVLDEASLEEQIVAKLDSLGDLYLKLAPLKAKTSKLTKEYKPLFEAIQDFIDIDALPDEEVSLTTEKYAAAFGQHGNASMVAAPGKAFKMLEAVEKGLGQKLMSFKVTDLNKYLTPEQVGKCVTTERTKARTVKIIKLDEKE